jgi:hypothetical protein
MYAKLFFFILAPTTLGPVALFTKILTTTIKILKRCNDNTILHSCISEWAILSTYIGKQTFILIRGMIALTWVQGRDKVLILDVKIFVKRATWL